MFWIGLLIGLLIGSFLGVWIISMCVASAEADKRLGLE